MHLITKLQGNGNPIKLHHLVTSQPSFCVQLHSMMLTATKGHNSTLVRTCPCLQSVHDCVWIKDKYMKNYLKSSIIREMYLKITIIYHYRLRVITQIKKTDNTKHYQGSQLSYVIARNSKQYSQLEKEADNFINTKTTLSPPNLVTPFQGIYPGEIKTCFHTNTYT